MVAFACATSGLSSSVTFVLSFVLAPGQRGEITGTQVPYGPKWKTTTFALWPVAFMLAVCDDTVMVPDPPMFEMAATAAAIDLCTDGDAAGDQSRDDHNSGSASSQRRASGVDVGLDLGRRAAGNQDSRRGGTCEEQLFHDISLLEFHFKA
jgi:hypothetical protein